MDSLLNPGLQGGMQALCIFLICTVVSGLPPKLKTSGSPVSKGREQNVDFNSLVHGGLESRYQTGSGGQTSSLCKVRFYN